MPRLFIARTFRERASGLLARAPLQNDQALLLLGCGAVHTLGMGYAVSLIYFDRRGRVLARRRCVKPWRVSACYAAAAVLELHPQCAAAVRQLLIRRAGRAVRCWSGLGDYCRTR